LVECIRRKLKHEAHPLIKGLAMKQFLGNLKKNRITIHSDGSSTNNNLCEGYSNIGLAAFK
jgi:hypothetical protein